ncbi:MAG: 3-deoxy-manno-octulosonate cytidylyltransferase [Bacteriovoracaceae bacterium]|nr:3-deoxy-manno-octulosonate cytidylyltransferase [Bacteriovoracaceae bacterium]
MNKEKVLILIPARFASTRFPGKPLAKVKDRSMIQTVYENCIKTGFTTCVVTDDESIEKHVQGFGGQVERVDDDVSSGSERILLAYQRFFKNEGFELLINVQGDEPLLKADELNRLANFHTHSDFDIATLVRPMTGFDEDFRDPNKVKVIFSEVKGICHYFSRASIPFVRDGDPEYEQWYQHIGVYSYRPDALVKFGASPCSYYESLEKLEQLRALELGMTIGAVTSNRTLIGVDTPEDLIKLEGVLDGQDE